MSIRLKIILVVVPLVLAALALTGVSSYFSASGGITAIGREFLGFKSEELQDNAESQWGLLVENGFTTRPEMVAATKSAVQSYARSIVRSPTELIFAVGRDGAVAMASAPVSPGAAESSRLAQLAAAKSTDLVTIPVAGRERVAKGFWFEPFQWYVLVTEERAAFYSSVDEIAWRTAIIVAVAIAAAVALVLLFASYLTRPITRVVRTMESIISTNDLSQRVVVEYHDEVGQLAQTFNLMTGELEKAYGRIKRQAYEKVVAQRQEQKIKEAFESYVPRDVIEELFRHPESMLVGRDSVISVLFCGISNFSSVSESLNPYDMVTLLNRYFGVMVDVIDARHGIVDKYIEHLIMALFGAPVKREQDADAVDSVLAGLEMLEALKEFNAGQEAAGGPVLSLGVGINYGVVTVGNIGTDKKMDYTVIGDMVNLASRLQGLTRVYHQELLISESLHRKVSSRMPCRLIDTVAVKGRKKGIRIYTAAAELPPAQKEAWDRSNAAMDAYYARDFLRATAMFAEVRRALPGDYPSELLAKRCQDYAKSPPPADWDGVEVMKTK
jgi:class 3 adenylate cyclase